MYVISKKKLREFWERHPDAEEPLRAWHRIVEKTTWQNFADVRAAFPSADFVGHRTEGNRIVFNVGGNKFRLIVIAYFEHGRVYVRHVLTHAEYDRGNWKKD
ncbi:MAG TPA: type II toxin-antitoxin system HigB family toxin [Thermoguttaceae bacterium]|nr:type II toxin-antitoxin system HigB family toxin [Thermoguttaceae bacterium]